ncbi:MAG: Rab family GTPase [Promethearchaeota archaeon]
MDEEIVFEGRTEVIYKIIVIGDPAVGKTSLLDKYSSKKFKTQYIPTVGTNIVKEIVEIEENGKNVMVNLMIWDIAGQPQFYMLHRPYFNGADGMMLVFDITRSSTFSNIQNWFNTAVKYGLSAVPRVIIGNKIDLKDERKIIKPMAEHLSDKLNCSYYETSAKTGDGVKIIFKIIAEIVRKAKIKS